MKLDHLNEVIATASTELTKDAYMAYHKQNKFLPVTLIVTFILTGIMLIVIDFITKFYITGVIGGLAIVMALLLVFIKVNNNKSTITLIEKTCEANAGQVSTFTFYEDCVLVENKSPVIESKFLLYYKEINSVINDENYIFVVSFNLIYIIDKNSLEVEENIVLNLLNTNQNTETES